MKLSYNLRKKIILSRPKRKALLGTTIITIIWLLLFVTALYILLYEIRGFNYSNLITPILLFFLLFLLYILITSSFYKNERTPNVIEEVMEDPLLEPVGRFIIKYQMLNTYCVVNTFFISYQHYAYLIDHLVMIGIIKRSKDTPSKILVHTESIFDEMLRRYREKGGRVKLYNWEDASSFDNR